MLTLTILSSILCFIAVAAAIYFRSRLWQVQVEYKGEKERLLEQISALKQVNETAKESFQNLAIQALDKNSERFLQLAKEKLEQKQTEVNASLEQKSQKFEQMVQPMRELLQKMESDFQRVERERGEQFGRLSESLKSVWDVSEKLRQETSTLSSALRRPEVRGSWGEIQLRRVVELAGMNSYCDFAEQVTARSEDNLLKPDMIINLPNKRQIIVDAKAVLDAYLDAIEAQTDEERKIALAKHANNVRVRVKDLSKKSYWDLFSQSPDFVILFIPNEALLAAALEVDRTLIEDAIKERIIIASPTTLVSVLKAIAYGWQQEEVHQNAQSIIQAAKDFYDRLSPWLKKLEDVGGKLESAVKSYNESIGSLEARVLPSARKIKDLGFHDRDELAKLEVIDRAVRIPRASD